MAFCWKLQILIRGDDKLQRSMTVVNLLHPFFVIFQLFRLEILPMKLMALEFFRNFNSNLDELYTFDWAAGNVRTALVCVPWTWRQQQAKCIDHHKSVSSWSECISSVRLRITMGFISCSHSQGLSEPGGQGGPPRFWQFSYSYLNQGWVDYAPRILRPSFGPT